MLILCLQELQVSSVFQEDIAMPFQIKYFFEEHVKSCFIQIASLENGNLLMLKRQLVVSSLVLCSKEERSHLPKPVKFCYAPKVLQKKSHTFNAITRALNVS